MLRQLVITRKIAEARKALDTLTSRSEARKEKEKALEARETELANALDEVMDDTPEEDRLALDAEIDAHTEESDALKDEAEKDAAEIETLNQKISDLEKELEDLNAKPPGQSAAKATESEEKRSEPAMSGLRFFRNTPSPERTAIFERSEVKTFMERVRTMIREKRAVNAADLLIPSVLLSMLRDRINSYSKLAGLVNRVRVPGTARQTIAGTIPEGVWTEMCATLNELDISFNQIEVDGYKVGGFIAVCNALLEDSDINLADEIMWNIGQAIGIALDKAILYGTGTKMPTGILTRLAQTAAPSNWGANAPAWTDLHTSNLLLVNGTTLTDIKFYQALILALGTIRPDYSTGSHFWAMNTKTYASLQAKALVFNAAGAIVSGQTRTMPIVGGDIVKLDFIPANDIIGGYGSLYLLAERAGIQLAQSEHYKFVEDQTVFKGTARYDGMPVFGEGFVAVNIANVAPTTTVAFAPDTANTTAPEE